MQWLFRVLLLLGLLSCLEAQSLKCQKSTRTEYDCMASPNQSYTLYWKLEKKMLHLGIEARTLGWAGICFPRTRGRMFPADSVIGWVDEGQKNVKPYYLTSHSVTSDDVNPSVTLCNTKGREENGRTLIEFCLKLDELTNKVNPQKVTDINWAYGDDDGLTYHGNQRASATIRFADKPDDDAPPAPPPSKTKARASSDD